MEHVLKTTGYKVTNNEELMEVAPAAFSKGHNRSRVYSYVSTTDILENLKKLGWEISYAKQQGTSEYSRHLIRLTNEELGYMPLEKDKVRPQLILDNSHNGISSAQLHMGLFRMVCESEMVISIPNLFSNVKFRHMGLNFEELKEITSKMAEQYKVVGTHISEMQNVVLSKEQQIEFAYKGVAYKDPRFIKDDGTINYPLLKERINPAALLEPMRGGDSPRTLWETFQNIREWLIKGGFEQKSPTGRVSRSKAINNAVRQISLNKTLWTLAEEYLNKPLEIEIFDKLVHAANIDNGFRTYVTAKGEEKQVMVIADLGNGRTQVKDIKANRVFAVATAKLS